MRTNPFLSYVSSRGGLITNDFLQNLRCENVENDDVEPQTFKNVDGGLPTSKKELDEQILEAWDYLLERWDSISQRYLDMDTSTARTKWIIPLLEGLGFEPSYNKQAPTVGEKLSFQLSHKGWNSRKAPVINCVSPSQSLEQPTRNASAPRSRSPHDELQAYLNVTKDCKWGIVTNGVTLRVLRQFYHITTKGYVEFDIENIFRDRSYSDFRLLFRIAHSSRFAESKGGKCILENFYEESKVAGVRIGQDLRKNVKKAIESLANGFLTPELTKNMISNEALIRSYYSELLRIIYRVIFLLFAEQRGILPTRDSIYADEYSVNKLREIAENASGEDDHLDLWEGLKVTFKILKNGSHDLKVFAYNGTLFDETEIPMLSQLSCANSDLLFAISQLTSVEQEHVRNRVNYLDLSVEEIGSIYENLLEYVPKVADIEEDIEGERVRPGSFYLDPRGATRKSSGSYYTTHRLIDELIKSALAPVLEKKLSEVSDKEKAILSIKVCDPACGSGAFLIAANNFLAHELARLRTSQLEPMDHEVRKARRDVLQHCIYGVDVNPMAIELAKVSLWINASVDDMPLNFLDHHVKCGDSLIGATPTLLTNGIPIEAFTSVEGDDREFSNNLRKRNLLERRQRLIDEFKFAEPVKYPEEYATLGDLVERDPGDVEKKKRTYASIIMSPAWRSQRYLADVWTAAFFWPLRADTPHAPTESILRTIRDNQGTTQYADTLRLASELALRYRFFHWYLEFPDVFHEGGFDLIAGNMPWETLQPEEKRFFSTSRPDIASAEGAKRKKLIANLQRENPKLHSEWLRYVRDIELHVKSVRFSGRFQFQKGKVNLYAVFTELARNLINGNGRAGIIVQTGIATDEGNKEQFQDLIRKGAISSLYDFENREGLFPEVHRSQKFCLLTISGADTTTLQPDFACFITNADQLPEPERHFILGAEDFELINPNTLTMPVFSCRRNAEIVKRVYRRLPILVREKPPQSNPWGIRLLQGLFNMTSDSKFFKTRDELEPRGFQLEAGAIFRNGEKIFLPLYEGRMIHHFDHRHASMGVSNDATFRSGVTLETSEPQHSDPAYSPLPRYWVQKGQVEEAMPKDYDRHWFIGFKDVTSPTNERTMICSIIPRTAVGNKLPLILTSENPSLAAALVANLSSFVFDFITRQKIGGISLNFYILKQLPIIPPSGYPKAILQTILSNTLELVFTSDDISPFARDCGYEGKAFNWEPERRILLRSELDAIYAHLYRIPRDDLDYILEAFPIVRKKEQEIYSEYLTKRLILSYYDKYEGKIEEVIA